MDGNELQQAITAIKAGDKVLGCSILAQVVQREPKNELAWLWLSTCVSTDEDKLNCLRKALEINPINQNTKKALRKFSARIDEPTVEDIIPNDELIPEKLKKKCYIKLVCKSKG